MSRYRIKESITPLKFIKKNNKYPSEHSKDYEEKKLGQWVQNQKLSKKGIGNYKITKENIQINLSFLAFFAKD